MRKFCLLIIILWSVKGFAQVNLPTGSATFSLPMFSWQDDKSRLNSLVELDYNSGNGLRVNDVASDIGQGWNLIEGGVITRIQAGEPDDQKAYEGNGTSEDVTKYPNGYLYDQTPAGCSNALTRYPIYMDKNHIYKQHNSVAADKELDHFAYRFNGRSGVFVLGKNSYGSPGPVSLGDTKLKIWFDKDETMINQGIRTTISVFYIRDENGLVYKFSQQDQTKVLKAKFCNADLSSKRTQPNLKSGGAYYESMYDDVTEVKNPWVINGWHLTEIKDPLTQRTVTFNYTVLNINAETGTSISYYSPGNYSIVSHSISISKSPKISSITFPDTHQVFFNYGAERWGDMKGDLILSSVGIKYQNRYLSKYIFGTSYFIKNRYGNPLPDSEKKLARLCLLSVKKMGPDLKAEDKPYLFDYYLGSSAKDDFVPPPFFHLKDIWGFYNGDESKEVNGRTISINSSPYNMSNVQLKGLCFLRDGVSGITLNPKQGYAKNGLLHQITYPTGGSLNYDYDQNKAVLNGQNVFVGGVHVSKTTVTDGGYSNDCNNPLTTNYTYSLDPGNTQPSLWGVETPLNSVTINNHYSPEKKYFDGWSLGCKYHFQYPGILSRDNSVALTAGQQVLQILSKIASIVGTVSEVLDVIKLAATGTGPAAVIIDAIVTVFNFVYNCFIDPSKDKSMTIYYNSDLNASNPLPSQFKRVEVAENSGTNGKTVYEFTSSDDYPVWASTNPTFSMKQRYAYWAYGLPKKTTVYDNLNNPVKQTENIYDATYAQRSYFCHTCNIEYMSYKSLVTKNSSQKAYLYKGDQDYWENPDIYNDPNAYTTDMTSNPDMKVDGYDTYTGRTLLAKTIERMFKKGNPSLFLATTTEFFYNNADYTPSTNYEVNEIKTTESNGDVYDKTIRYDNALLNQNNIITTPFETTTSFTKNNSSAKYYTGESVTEYATLPNGNIAPSRTLVQRFNAPVPEASMSFYVSPNSPSNPPYKQTQTFIYDANSNLSGLKDEGIHSVVNIYDYNDKYVAASVINADPTLDKCAYTSFETNDFTRSGWTMNGAVVYNPTSAITGSSSLVLSSGKSLSVSSLNTLKPYKLSFWASTSGISVNGNATLVKSAPTLNGFTYYEYNIAQGTSAVTVSGSGNIDELRLYPQNARMRTVTYDPLIGKTSECDENNRISYYEYDELGRMRYIKDENRNIVKMYEYNVKSKNTGCATTFHNFMVSEVFTRDNCSAGYAGTDTTYIIPDSKYTSTVSQADVDQKVQDDLNSFGQNFANTYGSCKKLYYSDILSQSFTKEGCAPGYKGTSITYTVPANRYTSTISKTDANAQAQEEMDANAQSYANLPGNASCVIDNTANYIGEEDAPTQCQQSGGTNTGHQLILVTDVNPNSPTYNQTKWADMGINSDACPMPQVSCTFMPYTGFNIATGSIFSSGGTVSFYIVIGSQTGTTYWPASNIVATISGCRPSQDRTLTMTESGRIWEVIITTSGYVKIRLTSGTPPSGTNYFGLTGGTYSL